MFIQTQESSLSDKNIIKQRYTFLGDSNNRSNRDIKGSNHLKRNRVEEILMVVHHSSTRFRWYVNNYLPKLREAKGRLVRKPVCQYSQLWVPLRTRNSHLILLLRIIM